MTKRDDKNDKYDKAEEITLFNFSYDGKIIINDYIHNEKIKLEYRN